MSENQAPDPLSAVISYEEFGRQFFLRSVTPERILAGVNVLAGQPIDFGPIGVGPGRIAKVRARGAIGEAVSTTLPGDLVALTAHLPVQLDFEVNLQVETQKFRAQLDVPLVLTVRALDSLRIFIDVTPPEARQISIDLQAGGLRATLLQRIADIDGEVQRFVARYVAREVQKPAILKARTIDVGAGVDAAWRSVAPKPTGAKPVASQVASDFAEAAVEELGSFEGEG